MNPTARIEFESIRRSKIYEEIARQIERLIAEMKPGDMLPPERELSRMFGVSRGSVRDAIRKLESVGLVEPRQGSGTVVRDVSAELLAAPLTTLLTQKRNMVTELIEVRKMVEPPLAARAASHATAEELADMEAILGRQAARMRQGELAIEEDSEFHYAIALAANNSVVLKVLDVLMDLLRETRERSLQVSGRLEKSFAGHQRILAALKRRDSAAAESAMRRHLQEIETIVLKKL